jgi:hypothetical protein
MALAGHVPAARSAESWVLQEDITGDVMHWAQQALSAAGAPGRIVAYLIPAHSSCHEPDGDSPRSCRSRRMLGPVAEAFLWALDSSM